MDAEESLPVGLVRHKTTELHSFRKLWFTKVSDLSPYNNYLALIDTGSLE